MVTCSVSDVTVRPAITNLWLSCGQGSTDLGDIIVADSNSGKRLVKVDYIIFIV